MGVAINLLPGDMLVVWRLTPLFRPAFRRIPFHGHDVAGLGFGIEMQFDPASVELTQDRLDSPVDGRMVRAVAGDELVDDGSERDG
jgi:hypothetical protein